MHELVILSTRSEDDSRPPESSNMQYSLLQNDTIVHLRRQVTLRATIAGLAIGSMILFSNFQFGLQTGWVSMMSLPSALISYAVFRAFPGLTKEFPFTREENVYAQSVAVAVGTGPLAFGLVGIVPAIEKLLTPEENDGKPIFMHIGQLILWSLSLSLFGVFFAVLLRRQVIVREQLKFPSGSATATMISVLHEGEKVKAVAEAEIEEEDEEGENEGNSSQDQENHRLVDQPEDEETEVSPSSYPSYARQVKILKISFAFSALCTLIQHFLPILRNLPIFGGWLAKNYLWTFNPSPGYIGQGFIMGLHTTSSMLLGCVLGWGVLAPYSQHKGWAPGPIDDWKTGGQGWILWISLALMVGDSVVSLLVLTYKQVWLYFHAFLDTESAYTSTEAEDAEHEHPEYDLSSRFAMIGILLSSLLCLVGIKVVFPQIHLIQIIVSVFIALLLSVLGVRALGETDLNPVSGIGKISQIFLSLIPNSTILSNLVAGAIAEAGAQQAGDLMQDLKTGHLIGAYPKSQFIAQITGSLFSVFLSGLVYRLYTSVYEIPGSLFRIPTAIIWVDCARLVMGGGLPEKVGTFTAVFGVIGSALAVLRDHAPLLPSGVAIGVGLYNVPSFTLARFLGGVIAYFYQKRHPDAHIDIIVCSSGLILGEGIMSIITMLLTALTEEHSHG
ncbi:putative oligopeptide transporter [Yarrowia sp. C11]|nr:putative oligopeptide transporter [Yarrowia sp. E02]KAG5372319.1 putative oligopeptide transporter [Yarrowia sp. C11]